MEKIALIYALEQRREWHPTPVLLPGKSQGRGSLVGCHLWGRTESNMTEAMQQQQQQQQQQLLLLIVSGLGSLVGCHLWGRTESNMTEET